MNQRILLTLGILGILLVTGLGAQTRQSNSDTGTAEASTPEMGLLLEALKNQAIVLKVQVRQLDQDRKVIWFSDVSRITVHGRLVNFKIEGGNTLIDTQFTPFRKDASVLLMVQSQIWVKGADQKTVQYYTHVQSLPSTMGEPVLYYPLGRKKSDGSGPANEVEVEVVILPYQEPAGTTNNP